MNELKAQSTDMTGKAGRVRLGANGVSDVPKSEPAALTVTAGAPRSIFTITNQQLDRMKILAQMVAASAFSYGSKLSEPDAFLVMIKGMELGLEPMASLASIDIIQGKPTLSPQGMLALINRTGELENMTIETSTITASVMMKRNGRDGHTEVFTIDNAKALGFAGKKNWKEQPATMLKWRAVAACARVVFPDVIQGLYTQEEIGAEVVYTDDGSVIADVPTLPEPPPPPVETMPELEPETELKPRPAYDQQAVIAATAFMYKHGAHAANSIGKLVSEGKIKPDITTEQACVVVLFHRAVTDYNLDTAAVLAALDVSRWGEWTDQGKTLVDAWDIIKEHFPPAQQEMPGTPPATPKDDIEL